MLASLAKTINRPCLQLSIALGIVVLSPLAVIAEPKDQSCETARQNIEQTQNILRPLKQQQQQIQQHVRTIYQELFACKTGSELSLVQQKYCTQLQKEGPKQFQNMIEVITLRHQTSQLLAHQTKQAQLTCPILTEDTFPQIARLGHS